jgi:hypothetical protein
MPDQNVPLSRRRQRATLIIACTATAMLCLDIAVVNTALPNLARNLHSGLSGVQWDAAQRVCTEREVHDRTCGIWPQRSRPAPAVELLWASGAGFPAAKAHDN